MQLCLLTTCIRGTVAQVSDVSHGPLVLIVTKNFILFNGTRTCTYIVIHMLIDS